MKHQGQETLKRGQVYRTELKKFLVWTSTADWFTDLLQYSIMVVEQMLLMWSFDSVV